MKQKLQIMAYIIFKYTLMPSFYFYHFLALINYSEKEPEISFLLLLPTVSAQQALLPGQLHLY